MEIKILTGVDYANVSANFNEASVEEILPKMTDFLARSLPYSDIIAFCFSNDASIHGQSDIYKPLYLKYRNTIIADKNEVWCNINNIEHEIWDNLKYQRQEDLYREGGSAFNITIGGFGVSTSILETAIILKNKLPKAKICIDVSVCLEASTFDTSKIVFSILENLGIKFLRG